MIRIKELFRPKRPAGERILPVQEYIGAVQRRTADFLNAKTKTWPAARLKLLLVCFCLAAGGYCAYVMGRAILFGNGPPSPKGAFYGVPQKPLSNKQLKPK